MKEHLANLKTYLKAKRADSSSATFPDTIDSLFAFYIWQGARVDEWNVSIRDYCRENEKFEVMREDSMTREFSPEEIDEYMESKSRMERAYKVMQEKERACLKSGYLR